MSEGQIIDIYNQGVSEVIGLIKELSNQIRSLDSQIETLSKGNKALTERVKSLESQVNKNSNNSSKLPSSDCFKKKTKSLRTKSDKNPDGQKWAEPTKNLLIQIKKEIDVNWNAETVLSLAKIHNFEAKYDETLKAGFEEDYAKNIELYSQKKVKRSVSLNLLNRLSGYKSQIFAFMYDFNIPFDNNLAERDLRMAKVKQKISGAFRSSAEAKVFTRIRVYVSAVRKQNKNALDCLKSIFTENPFDPTFV